MWQKQWPDLCNSPLTVTLCLVLYTREQLLSLPWQVYRLVLNKWSHIGSIHSEEKLLAQKWCRLGCGNVANPNLVIFLCKCIRQIKKLPKECMTNKSMSVQLRGYRRLPATFKMECFFACYSMYNWPRLEIIQYTLKIVSMTALTIVFVLIWTLDIHFCVWISNHFTNH